MFFLFSSILRLHYLLLYFCVSLRTNIVENEKKKKEKFFRIWGLNWVQLENTFFLAINFRLSGFENFTPLSLFGFCVVNR